MGSETRDIVAYLRDWWQSQQAEQDRDEKGEDR
jgi:hypothetical protein